MIWSALSMEPCLSNEKRASTSVETLPGTILRISFPNSTKSRSRVASTCSSMPFACDLPYSTATSMSFAYSGFFDAARIKDGFVVASCGLYLPIAEACQREFCKLELSRFGGDFRTMGRGGFTDMRSHL